MTDNLLPFQSGSDKDEQLYGRPHYPGMSNESSTELSQEASEEKDRPTSPPPAIVPQQKQMGTLTVDPGALVGCLNRNTFILLSNHQSFWIYPTYIDRNTVSGYKWNGYIWIPWGTDLDRIISFQCS
ncbi:collagen-like protein [Filibacter tadaridae]|uniref:Transporter n=1 Tax=Filibacter tadaridae TaxID=2483811 RepID=A0A3P5XWL0_9BACL|nr:collagen-like protein [Filibacter tadaridae]VDC33552.1 hypothetical protein FILTAD_02962 [Filibacter tadaridae]